MARRPARRTAQLPEPPSSEDRGEVERLARIVQAVTDTAVEHRPVRVLKRCRQRNGFPEAFRRPLVDLRWRPDNHQGEQGTLNMMLAIDERICRGGRFRRQPESRLANANVRPKPNRKRATQWTKTRVFRIYRMKAKDFGGDGVRRSLSFTKVHQSPHKRINAFHNSHLARVAQAMKFGSVRGSA